MSFITGAHILFAFSSLWAPDQATENDHQTLRSGTNLPRVADGGVELAVGEANGNVVAKRDLIRRAQYFPRRVVGDRVASFEQPERVALFQWQSRRFKAAFL